MTDRIVAPILTDRDVDDASQVEPLLDQIADPVEVFLDDGGYDRTGVYSKRRQVGTLRGLKMASGLGVRFLKDFRHGSFAA